MNFAGGNSDFQNTYTATFTLFFVVSTAPTAPRNVQTSAVGLHVRGLNLIFVWMIVTNNQHLL